MPFCREDIDYKKYIINSIKQTQYITKNKTNSFIETLSSIDKDTVNFDEIDSKEFLIEQINQGNDEAILKLEEYEYDKYYKYSVLYSMNICDLDKTIEKLKINGTIIENERDYISNIFERPKIKEFEDTIDLKFSYIKSTTSNYHDGFKYPVIITIHKEINLIQIKYCAMPVQYLGDKEYIKIHDDLKKWILDNLKCELNEINSFDISKKILCNKESDPVKYSNVSEYLISMDDEFNGRTTLRATDQDNIPLLVDILALADTFKNESDKNKIYDYIARYKRESIIQRIALKWKHKFSNNNGKPGKVIVSLRKVYEGSDNSLLYKYTHLHFFSSESMNRERINYAIKYLSEHI